MIVEMNKEIFRACGFNGTALRLHRSILPVRLGSGPQNRRNYMLRKCYGIYINLFTRLEGDAYTLSLSAYESVGGTQKRKLHSD